RGPGTVTSLAPASDTVLRQQLRDLLAHHARPRSRRRGQSAAPAGIAPSRALRPQQCRVCPTSFPARARDLLAARPELLTGVRTMRQMPVFLIGALLL